MPVRDVDLCLRVLSDAGTAAFAAASLLAAHCRKAVAVRGFFTLAVSGGSTPVPLFRLLRAAARREDGPKSGGQKTLDPAWIDWSRGCVFWADERCVPPEHGMSNFGLAMRELLDGLPQAPQLFRMHGEDEPEKAARDYETTLRSQFFCGEGAEGLPRFDCILLGMGADGHTASLFPKSPVLEEKKRLVAVTEGPDPEHPGGKLCRLTLTLPMLNAARMCLFLACGAEKRLPLARALDLLAEPCLPVQRVRPHAGRLVWFSDTAAAPLSGSHGEDILLLRAEKT